MFHIQTQDQVHKDAMHVHAFSMCRDHAVRVPMPLQLLISKKSRRSREQAFVEFATVEQAQHAITWLDTVDLPALVKQPGCGGLVVRFADRKRPNDM